MRRYGAPLLRLTFSEREKIDALARHIRDSALMLAHNYWDRAFGQGALTGTPAHLAVGHILGDQEGDTAEAWSRRRPPVLTAVASPAPPIRLG